MTTPAFEDQAGEGTHFTVPEKTTKVTWVFTDCDEVLAILRGTDEPS